MDSLKSKIDELAQLMEDFRLSEAEISSEGARIAFRRKPVASAQPVTSHGESVETTHHDDVLEFDAAPVEPKVQGIPIASPMNGIFYSSPSPSAPAFVKIGETVTAGQVVALIEAMKVFNEITAPMSGTVLSVAVETGQVVQPGDPLIYVG